MTDNDTNWNSVYAGEPAEENPAVPDDALDHANWIDTNSEKAITVYLAEGGSAHVVRYDGEQRVLELEDGHKRDALQLAEGMREMPEEYWE